jgi:glycosyltransferase involved in cell wall biosynthesis
MKVLIDFTQIPLNKAGAGSYAESLITEIFKMESFNEYFITVLDDDIEFLGKLKINDQKYRIIRINKIFRKLFFRFCFEQIMLPFLLILNRIKILHSLHYSFPLITVGVKKIVTLHDMTFFLFPEFHEKLQLYYFKFMIRASLKFCDRIICVSNSTRLDVIKLSENDLSDKLFVVPLGTSYNKASYDTMSDTGILDNHDIISKKYFLFIGTLEPRKNIESIIHAFSKFLLYRNCDFELVIVGKNGWNYIGIFDLVKELNLESNVKFTGYVSELEKKQLIYNSFLFVYPSFYEGFGLPVLEAMSYGIPCITSNVSSMPEVAGDAAILIDPLSVYEIYEAFVLLVDNEILYKNLSEKALLRVQGFTWRDMALKTVSLYN